jgi:hypothetical protein
LGLPGADGFRDRKEWRHGMLVDLGHEGTPQIKIEVRLI